MHGMSGDACVCRRMPCFAAAVQESYNPGQRRDRYGGTRTRDGQSAARSNPTGETTRRSSGFVEGNRGISEPRRDDRAALGKAGRDAGTPAPARSHWFGLRVSRGTGRVDTQSQPTRGPGKRVQYLAAESTSFHGAPEDVEPANRAHTHRGAGGGPRGWREPLAL